MIEAVLILLASVVSVGMSRLSSKQTFKNLIYKLYIATHPDNTYFNINELGKNHTYSLMTMVSYVVLPGILLYVAYGWWVLFVLPLYWFFIVILVGRLYHRRLLKAYLLKDAKEILISPSYESIKVWNEDIKEQRIFLSNHLRLADDLGTSSVGQTLSREDGVDFLHFCQKTGYRLGDYIYGIADGTYIYNQLHAALKNGHDIASK